MRSFFIYHSQPNWYVQCSFDFPFKAQFEWLCLWPGVWLFSFSISPLMCTIHSAHGSFGILFKRNEMKLTKANPVCRCCCSCCWWHEIKITKSCISIAIIRHSFPNNQTNYHDSQRAKIIIQCMIIRCDMVKMYMLSFKCRVWMYFSLLISLISLLNAVNFCSYPGCNAFFFFMEFKYCKMSLSSINIISMLGAFHMAGCETTNAMS